MLTANNSLLILKLEIRCSAKQITRDNFALAASLTIRWLYSTPHPILNTHHTAFAISTIITQQIQGPYNNSLNGLRHIRIN
ncbi:hypothetical protein LCER1_G006104 [Lachnellula cervina]|uniref:Uncharacterized protein n=1 Tax=Lachnellula cervina TaxID=1316786 RepID=A0A7D8UMM9_9HELO|nr:hypothetical protein LCER1_G006104 [Lachnellula cervina]